MGRSNFSGPMTGAYVVMHGHGRANGETAEWKAPFACRVMSVSAHAQAGTSPTYGVTNAGANVIAAGRTAPTTPETVEGATLTNRDVAKGSILLITFGGTNPVVDVWVTVWVKGHAVASATND